MKKLLTISLLALCATASAQTIKSLGYNTTNGQVVYSGTNTLTFTNATVAFGAASFTNALETRSNLGLVGTGFGSVIGGGGENEASAQYTVVSGGYFNIADNYYATVSGGSSNYASGNHSVVIGGLQNGAYSPYSVASGGYNNIAEGNYSYVAGRRAKATNEGAFVWADSTDADFSSTGDNTFNIRASGGVYLDLGTNGILFANATNSAVTRTNLGLGGGITATNVFVDLSTNTNTVTISNGIITSWTVAP